MDFNLPPYNLQNQIMVTVKPILEKKKRIDRILEKIDYLKSRVLSQDYTSYQITEVPIGKVVRCQGGNSGLTEEYLYSQIQDTSKQVYRILTGSTNYETSQYIHKCKHPKNPVKDIATVDGKPIIHVVRKGKAGYTTFFDTGYYTLNDDAYILYLNEKFPYEINLQWLMYNLKSQFLEYSTSSDNGTWNKTSFFKNVQIDIPSIAEQKKVLKNYQRLEELEKKLSMIGNQIENLFNKQITS